MESLPIQVSIMTKQDIINMRTTYYRYGEAGNTGRWNSSTNPCDCKRRVELVKLNYRNTDWEENLVEPSLLHVSNFNVILLSSVASSHFLLYWKSTMRHLFILNGGGEEGGRTRTKESQNPKCIWNFQAKYKVF